MYEEFFQLQARPFSAAPLVANYFPSQSMESARQNLIRAIERGEGPGVVIGPTGVGKTMLLRVLADQFGQVVRVVMLAGTRIATRKSLLQSILFELEMPYRGMDEGELRLALIDALRRCEAIPNGILLLIDEAHFLPLRLLDEARLITNVVHDNRPRVRLVLAGSPQLEERFTNPKLDSFNQRLAARCYLQPFSRDETDEYVRAEISWAGGDADAIISDDAIQAVHRASDGIPRIINQVCDRALVIGQMKMHGRIEADLIQEAWADLQQLPPPWSEPRSPQFTDRGNVVEFGQLEDSNESPTFHLETPVLTERGMVPERTAAGFGEALELARFAAEREPILHTPTDHDAVAQNDCPCDEVEFEGGIFHTDTVLVSAPFVEETPEWTNCGEIATVVEETRSPELNPFSDSFDEEIVVIDRTLAQTTDGLRGRPRVSCLEGREIVEALAQLPKARAADAIQIPQEDISAPTPVTPTGPAFEFSTLQDLPAIDLLEELCEEPDLTESQANEHVEFELDDEADCVPLPWTRGTPGDDRDIIVVEEDGHVELDSAADLTTPNPHRAEYRELFAQLRRASN